MAKIAKTADRKKVMDTTKSTDCPKCGKPTRVVKRVKDRERAEAPETLQREVALGAGGRGGGGRRGEAPPQQRGQRKRGGGRSGAG